MFEENDRAGFARGGLAAMPAFADAPELYRPVPATNDPLARAEARRDGDFALRVVAEATALGSRLRESMPQGPVDGFATRTLEQFDAEIADLLAEAPSPRAENAANAAIGRARSRLLNWALPQEAAGQTVARRQQLVDVLAEIYKTVENQPDDSDALHAEGAAAIANAADWLGARAAQRLSAQWAEELYTGAAKGLVDKDPDAFLQSLSSGGYGYLPDEKRDALQLAAERRLSSLRHDAEKTESDKINAVIEGNERVRWQYVEDFERRIENGTASMADLDKAQGDGNIRSIDFERLRKRLRFVTMSDRERQAGVARVADFVDGKSLATPSSQDIEAHYKAIMMPVLDAVPEAERGRLMVDYLQRVKRIPTVRKMDFTGDLPPPTDDPIDPQALYDAVQFDPKGISEIPHALLVLSRFELGALLGASIQAMSAASVFPEPRHNNEADAFRHAYWSYQLTKAVGPEKAKMITDAHEVSSLMQGIKGVLALPKGLPDFLRSLEEYDENERLMDLYNNAKGRALASDPVYQDQNPKTVIMSALNDGFLQTRPFKIKHMKSVSEETIQ